MNSHTVRTLRVCCLCLDLGSYQGDSAIRTVICVTPEAKPRERKYCHPRCYMEEMGTAKLLSLPKQELAHIRMCDVPMRTMQRILEKAA